MGDKSPESVCLSVRLSVCVFVITSLQVFVCVSVISGRMRVIARRRSIGVLIMGAMRSFDFTADKKVQNYQNQSKIKTEPAMQFAQAGSKIKASNTRLSLGLLGFHPVLPEYTQECNVRSINME